MIIFTTLMQGKNIQVQDFFILVQIIASITKRLIYAQKSFVIKNTWHLKCQSVFLACL